MNVFTWLWLAVGVAALTIEAVALVNSRSGDTLSEHVWAWLGVRTSKWEAAPFSLTVTPKWTLRLARCVLIFGMVWLALHFTTGGWI